jgi:hypothetical protein
MPNPNATQYEEKYGMYWPVLMHPLARELEMVKKGGHFQNRKGEMVGVSLDYHFKEAAKLCWPEITFHKWNNLIIENYLTHRTIVVIGPASSGKTHTAAFCVLLDYYAFPGQTTILITSTTRELLEQRIWGELKKLHRSAVSRCRWLPGHMIDSRQRLVTDGRAEAQEGRDFRNGIVGVPCKKGNDFVGMGDFAGVKNKRVRLVGDELSLLPRVFVHAISNLDKNPDFKAFGLGNPKETTDALGVLAEPAADLGGWDGGIDQTPITKIWKTRRPNGIAIQLPGSDSPNKDGMLGIPLITQKQIDDDVAFYGKDSQWYTMMDEGMMPRGQGSRRVITRQLCLKHHAMDDPHWANAELTYIAFLDAAYRGVGGDRCVFGVLCFGKEVYFPDTPDNALVNSLISQNYPDMPGRQILYLMETQVVPIKAIDANSAEDQIVYFVKGACEQRGISPNNFFFDSGMRTSLVTAFARLWSNQVEAIDCGGTASDRIVSKEIPTACKDYYFNRITEFWYSVRLIIESEQFRGMTEDVMMEGCQREFTRTGNNKIQVEPKEKMKLKTGRSPDLFDALAIGIEGARQRGFQIRRLMSATQVVADDRWKNEVRKKAADFAAIGGLNYEA